VHHLAEACTSANEFAGMGWPGACAAVGFSVCVAFIIWVFAKYL
jgi:hypothetical protein